MKNNFQSKSVPRGTRTIWRYLGALFLLFTFGIGNVWAADYSPLNYNGGSTLPSGYKYYGSSAGTEDKSAFSITTYEGHTVFDVTAGGTGAYNKRAIEFTVSEDCTLDIEFYVGNNSRVLNLFHGNSTVVHSSTGTTKGDNEYTFSYSFEGITSEQTYSLSGSGSKVYISKITFTPAAACTETAPTSVAVSGGATYDKGDALSNLSAAVTGGTGTMSYQWYRNTTNAATVSNDLKLANCTTATLAPTNKVGTYYYYCVASNCAGSVTSGTTAVTINADCSATGDIFTMTMNSSNAPSSEVKTPASSTMSIDTYINIDGGDIVLVTGSSQHSSITTSPKIKLGGSSGYAKISLDCPLQEGDKITFVKTNKIALAADASGTNKIQLASGTNEYTITKEDCLYNQSNLFILRDGNNVEISSITITRPVMRTISFDSNGGSAVTAIKVEDGTVATKPADPTWAHHRFDGWYNGSDPYVWTANVTGNLTLTAHWTQLYTVTYAAGDGTATGDAPTQADKAATETFTVAANPFTVAGKDFVKWNDGTNDYAPGATYTVGTDNVVLTAQWKAATDKYTVIFKDGDTELGTRQFDVASNPSDAEIDKTKPMFTFAAWQKDDADIALDAEFWATVVKDATVTLTARWAKAFATSVDLEGLVEASGTGADWQKYLSDHGYAFSTSNVSLDEKKDPSENKPYDNWPYQGLKAKVSGAYVEGNIEAGKLVIIKLGHMAADATVTIDGVAQDNASGLDAAEPEGAMNYYYLASEGLLHYETTNAGACVLKAITITDPFTVSFDANGGDDVASLNGTPSVTLPLPVKGTESFLGWFDGETKVGMNGDKYTPTANITLVAHWEAVSTDARLSTITFSSDAGTLAPAFDPEVTEYTYTMPYGTAAIPTITGATKANANAQAPVIGTAATVWGEAQTVKGIAQSGAEKTYTITMKLAPKDGVEIIGVVTTGGTNKTVSGLYKGDASVNLDADKKIGSNKYIYVTLAEGYTFEETDVLVVDVAAKSDLSGGNKALEITTGVGNIDGAMWKSIAFEDYTTGENTISLTGIAAGQTSIGLKRSANQNAYINGLKVYRPMNPILTAITINGVDCEKGTGNAFSVILPNGTNLGSLTVVPTIVKNGEGGSAAPTAAWAWGANTYRVTDKDGDYTDYTITLTEAVPAVDPTLTYNEGAYMVGASALDLSTLISASTSTGAITYSVKDAGATGATITDGKFTATAAGTATITATQAATVAYNAKTVDFNVVVTVATEIDGIKLVETGALTGKFRIKADQLKSGAYTVEGINYSKYVQMGSTHTSFSGEAEGTQTKGIYYAPSKKNIKFWFYMRNTDTSARKIYIYKMEEGSAVSSETVSVDPGSQLVSYDMTLATNAEVIFGVENTKLLFCQIVAVESGDDLLQGGQAGYVFDYSKKRQNVAANTLRTIDGIDYKLYAESKINSASNVQLQTLGTHYIKFHLDAPMTVNVFADNKKYYVGSECSTDEAAMLYEATGDGEFTLAAGNWYINGSGAQVKINKLAFSLPKCEKPTITTQPATNHTFDPGDMTAMVVATVTEGTLHYQWYKKATVGDDEEVGTDAATLTTTTEGTYYVVVTNTLAGHQDVSVTSEEAELGHRVTYDATLMALSYGGTAITLEDGVYNYNVELAKGTTDVPALAATATMDGYATVTISNAAEFVSYAASSTVTVKSEDATVTNVYTVNFTVKHDLPQVDVTATTTWNWANAATTMQKIVPAAKNVEQLMANIDDEGKKLKNDAEFNSQALIFSGQEALVGNSTRWYAKGGHIKFNVTVPGIVKVEFSDNGTNNRRLKINNYVSTESSASETDVKTYAVYVQPGEVTLMGVKNDGTGTDQYIRISKIEFIAKAAPDYTRTVSSNIGTLCVDHNVLVGGAQGATFYQIVGRNQEYSYKIDFEEVMPNEELKAGEPYIFQSTTGRIDLFYGETVQSTPIAYKGMIGNYGQSHLDITEENKADILYISQNKLWTCEDLVGVGLTLNEHRCYIKMSDVPEQNPGQQNNVRRRVTLGKNAEQVATGCENLNVSDKPVKMIINGQLFILRGEKMYDAKGQLVK